MPGKGTPKQTIRVDPETWQRFGEAVGDRAAAIRAFMAWVLREPGAKMPRRPAVGNGGHPIGHGDHGGPPTDSGA